MLSTAGYDVKSINTNETIDISYSHRKQTHRHSADTLASVALMLGYSFVTDGTGDRADILDTGQM
jgi:hypothetical protein